MSGSQKGGKTTFPSDVVLLFLYFFEEKAFLLQTNLATSQRSLMTICCRKHAFVALLLLFPLKSCDFRGPRKVHPDFLGRRKSKEPSEYFTEQVKWSKADFALTMYAFGQTKACALTRFARSKLFFLIPKTRGCLKSCFLNSLIIYCTSASCFKALTVSSTNVVPPSGEI